MSFRIGFPVVLPDRKTCKVVWVTTYYPKKADPKVYWNDRELKREDPLGNNAYNANLLLNDILRSKRSIQLKCDDIPALRDEHGLFSVEVEGNSLGLILTLCRDYQLLDSPSHDVEILLSGRVERNGTARALGVDGCVIQKGQFAHDNRYAMVLHQNDYELLQSSRKNGWNGAGRSSRLPDTLEAIREEIDELGSGRAYVLPDGPEDAWESQLAVLLQLQPVVSVRPEPVSAPIVPSVQSHPQHGTVGELFSVAVPSKPEYLTRILERNAEAFGKALFKEGITAQAVEKREQVFCDSRNRSGFQFQNILLGGPTGCGKTRIAEAIMLNTVIELGSPVLYVAPTRALVYELYTRLHEQFCVESDDDPFLSESDVVVSTGELNEDDWRIQDGYFKIALIVNEKANLLMNPDMGMIRRIGLIVIDELHMLANPMRGGTIDMLIAKARMENTRREQLGDQSPLRMVGISTEEMVYSPEITQAFSVSNDFFHLKPESLVASQRPVTVRHTIRILEDGGFGDAIHVVDFASNKDRYLDDHRLSEIRGALQRIRPKHQKQLGADRESLRKLIQECSNRHSRILVAVPSIAKLKDIAGRVKKDRRAAPTYALPTDLTQILNDNVVAQAIASELREQARYGIYSHHGELPRELRRVIEEHFRERVSTDSPPEVLLATETLSFGVNLSVDCVILGDLTWTREDPSKVGATEEDIPLTPNEYHNLLGRAGRPGHNPRDIPEAVICFRPGSGTLDNLLAYYSRGALNPHAKRMTSGLLHPYDVLRLRSNLVTELNLVTYPTFRSVMDALRHASQLEHGSAVSIGQMMQVLRNTVFFEALTANDRTASTAEALVARVVAVAAQSKDLRLVSETGGKYRIEPQAEALIDTGTRWQSVSPMKEWLLRIRKFKSADQTWLVPPELLVPAFVASPDLWAAAKSFCQEARERNEPDSTEAQRNEDAARHILINELQHLPEMDKARAEEVERLISKYVDDLNPQLELDQTWHRKAIFCRLVTAFLLWLRGEAEDTIMQLSARGEGSRRVFQRKYSEKANWLARMCLRYFEATRQDHLLEEHVRGLPLLAVRLRHGVSADGIPFIQNAYGSRRDVTRQQVQELLEAGVKASLLVSMEDPASSIANHPNLSQPVRDKAKYIVNDVFAFYRSHVTSLARSATDSDTRDLWNEIKGFFCKKLLVQSQLGRSISPEQLRKFTDFLLKLLNAKNKGRFVLRESKCIEPKHQGTLFQICVSDPYGELALPAMRQGKQIVTRLPWPKLGTNLKVAVELSGLGGTVLALLISCTPSEEVQTAIARLAPRFYSIRDLVEEFATAAITERMRETLLSIGEPGVP